MKPLALTCLVLLAPLAAQSQDKCGLSGNVTDALTGEAIRKANILLRSFQGAVSQSASTDAAGHFAFPNVDPGQYFITAERTGFLSQSYGSHGRLRGVDPVTLAPGAQRSDIDFKLTRQGVIAGHVFDEDGEAMTGVTVACQHYVYTRGKKTLSVDNEISTNDLGEYRLFGLQPGKYYISALPRGDVSAGKAMANEEGYSATFYPGGNSAQSAVALDVTPGSQLRGIDLQMVKSHVFTVRGRTVDSAGKPLTSAGVSFLPRDMAVAMRNVHATSDGKGNFEARNLLPGAYTAVCDSLQDRSRLVGRANIEVGNANVEGVLIAVAPPAQMSGRIVVEGQTDVHLAAANVYLEPKSNNAVGGIGAPVSSDLTFHLMAVSPEAYDVNLIGLSGALYIKAIKIGEADVTDTGVDFTGGVPAAEMTLLLRNSGGQVDGVVQDDKQQPVSDATVVLIPASARRGLTRLYQFKQSAANGAVRFTGIPPGTYKLFAWQQVEMGSWLDPDFLKPFESLGETIDIDENARQSVQLKMIPAPDSQNR